jgi:hypothetical protein
MGHIIPLFEALIIETKPILSIEPIKTTRQTGGFLLGYKPILPAAPKDAGLFRPKVPLPL